MNNRKKKIVTVVGARPQFIKCALLSPIIRKDFSEYLIHTGQHYDKTMSDIFFNELNIPTPDINLEVGSGLHGEQTGKMLSAIEEILIKETPDLVMVYGDTNSTLAGALAAVKLQIPIAHVEAGLRSYNRSMPEEINRELTDTISTLLFCPTKSAIENLAKEGIHTGVYLTGDVMADLLQKALAMMPNINEDINRFPLKEKKYYLATIHRPSNTDVPGQILKILSALQDLNFPVVFPIHPRTLQKINGYGIKIKDFKNIQFSQPVSYLSMMQLLKNALAIITDSGGLQKEAYLLKTPCITIRQTTEWIETVHDGWNYLVTEDIAEFFKSIEIFVNKSRNLQTETYGEGKAADNMVSILRKFLINNC